MVTKSKKTGGKKKNVKVLNLKKETVKNLRSGDAKRVKGGITPYNSDVRASGQLTPALDTSALANSSHKKSYVGSI